MKQNTATIDREEQDRQANLRTKLGRYSTAELRGLDSHPAGYNPNFLAYLAKVADRLDAAGYSRLSEVPEQELDEILAK